jgi:hypothetical protein
MKTIVFREATNKPWKPTPDKRKLVVVSGSLVNGHRIHGTFESWEEAREWVAHMGDEYGEKVIIPMQEPDPIQEGGN